MDVATGLNGGDDTSAGAWLLAAARVKPDRTPAKTRRTPSRASVRRQRSCSAWPPSVQRWCARGEGKGLDERGRNDAPSTRRTRRRLPFAGARTVCGSRWWSLNYRSKLVSVAPGVKGLTVTVVDGDDAVELRNATGKNVLIPGYENEPYLRFLTSGRVEINVNCRRST